MLEALCGTKTKANILLFLFVNGKGYGTQLHHLFQTALTPIQKALLNLEKGGLITSYYEGKTRLYQLHPGYPLLTELEGLLKKAYTLLSPQEKKLYSFVRKESRLKRITEEENNKVLITIWERLGACTRLTFHAKTQSHEKSGWNGKGRGEVTVTKEGDAVLIFTEKGSWKGKTGHEFDFSNTFRWTLDRAAGMLSLEHLRHGLDHPVFLFYLTPKDHHALISVDSHLCGEDAYFGQLFCDEHALRLNWRVIGPKKNEELDYYYS